MSNKWTACTAGSDTSCQAAFKDANNVPAADMCCMTLKVFSVDSTTTDQQAKLKKLSDLGYPTTISSSVTMCQNRTQLDNIHDVAADSKGNFAWMDYPIVYNGVCSASIKL